MPDTYNLYNNQVQYAYLGATWLFEKLGGEGNVWYMRGIAGNPADSDRDIGFQMALDETPRHHRPPNPRGSVHRLGSDDGDGRSLTTSSPAAATTKSTASGRPAWTHQVVDAIKDAGEEFKPIVGADLRRVRRSAAQHERRL